MLPTLLLAAALASGWTVLPVPATNVTDVAASAAGRVYVAGVAFVGGNGIYRSADGGSSWERVFTTPLSEYVLTLAADPADPRHVFAATRHAGFAAFTTRLYGSEDGGASWTPRFLSFGASGCGIAVAGDMLYVAFYGGAFVRSRDAGKTFEFLPAPFEGARLEIASDGALVAAAADGQVFVSRDRGEAWEAAVPAPVGCDVTALAVDPSHPNLWFVASGDFQSGCGEVFRTEDGGATWEAAAGVGGPVSDLQTDAAHPDLLLAATSANPLAPSPGRVLSSTDGGATWKDLGLPVSAGAQALTLSERGGTLYAVTPAGVYARRLRLARPALSPR